MQPQERRMLEPCDFFQQTTIPLRLPVPPSEAGDSIDPHDPFPFSFEDTFGPIRMAPFAEINIQESISMRDDYYFEETCPFDDLLSPLRNKPPASHREQFGRGESRGEDQPSQEQLEAIVSFLAEYSHLGRADLQTKFSMRFPGQWQCGTVQTLAGRFGELKKTREQLVKYCMRKAFKFILELPKNNYLLPRPSKDEKYSLAKSKSRFLKQISSQKSMNNKFLGQIFSEGHFSQDYKLFLEHFEAIMQEDNRKKVSFLAWLLTHRQQGKQRTLQMVRRMPWTSSLLEKAKRVSFELLKHAPPG